MIHQLQYVKMILRKYSDGSATPSEMAMFSLICKIYTEEEILELMADNIREINSTLTTEQLMIGLPIAQSVIEKSLKQGRIRNLRLSLAIAASVFLLIFPGIFFLKNYHPDNTLGSNECTYDGDIRTRYYSCNLLVGDNKPVLIDSSVTGIVTRINDFEILQNTPGVLELRKTGPNKSYSNGVLQEVQVSTGPRQQYMVLLPDGTEVRLNAMSFLSLTVNKNDNTVQIGGEAYVQIPGVSGNKTVFKTWNARIEAEHAEINISSSSGYTNVVLVAGSLQVADSNDLRAISLVSCGDNGIIANIRPEGKPVRDTVIFNKHLDIAQALTWIRSNRLYNGVPLRRFVQDMSRWYGLQFSSLNCIPEDLKVRTVICSQAPMEEALAIIERAGVKIYREGSFLSFCPPDKDEKKSFNYPNNQNSRDVTLHSGQDPQVNHLQ
ncbi:MAG: FecR domain-containing protein [Chitinophagaceae bacterium]